MDARTFDGGSISDINMIGGEIKSKNIGVYAMGDVLYGVFNNLEIYDNRYGILNWGNETLDARYN